MSKKKHPEHVNHERWLVSYADFITLLFAFFVVLFASGQNDKRKQVKLAQAMQSAFQYNGIFDQHTKTPPLTEDTANAPAAVPSPILLPVPAAIEQEKLAESHTEGDERGDMQGASIGMAKRSIEAAIHDAVALKEMDADSITIHESDEGLVVSLHEAGFFDSGSAEIRPLSIDGLKALAQKLPRVAMRVEGHTDDVPIHTAQFATNWELSAARAAVVTRLLIHERAVEPAKVAAVGFAEFHPVALNATEAGRQQNRRVDIVLLKLAPHQDALASPQEKESPRPPPGAAAAQPGTGPARPANPARQAPSQ